MVEQPAVALFRDLGYATVSRFNETFGPHGTLGRETTGDVVLVPRLRAALQKLNPKLPVASRSVFSLFTPDENTFADSLLWKNLLVRACPTLLWEGERAGKKVWVRGGC